MEERTVLIMKRVMKNETTEALTGRRSGNNVHTYYKSGNVTAVNV